MAPTISRLLLGGNAEIEAALDSRLRKLTIEKTDSEKPLLETQEEEVRRERIFLRNVHLLRTLEQLVDAEEDATEFQKKAEKAIEAGYHKTLNTKEFYQFMISHGVRGKQTPE